MTIKKNIIFVLIEKLYIFVIGFYLLTLVSNHLGSHLYGVYSFSISIILLAMAFARLGLNQLVINYLVHFSNNIDSILLNTFVLKLFVGIVMGIITYIFLSYKIEDYNANIVSLVLVFYAFEVFEFWIQSLRKNYIVSILNMLTITIISILTYLAVKTNAKLELFLVIYVLSATLKYILLGFYYFSKGNYFFNNYSKVKLNFLFNKTKPLFLASIFTASFMQIDQIMIEMILGINSVGIYSLAVNVNNYVFAIPMTFFAIILPYLSKYKKDYNFMIFNNLFIVTTSILFYILFSLAIFLYLFSDIIFNLLFTSDFNASIEIYNILLIALPIVGINLSFYNYFVLIKRNDINLKATFIALLSNIILNYILLRIYGPIGAAYASVLSYYILVFLLYSFIFYKSKNIFYIVFPFFYKDIYKESIELIRKDF
jgi:O-antigen/teichoic acid export membrane protein